MWIKTGSNDILVDKKKENGFFLVYLIYIYIYIFVYVKGNVFYDLINFFISV